MARESALVNHDFNRVIPKNEALTIDSLPVIIHIPRRSRV